MVNPRTLLLLVGVAFVPTILGVDESSIRGPSCFDVNHGPFDLEWVNSVEQGFYTLAYSRLELFRIGRDLLDKNIEDLDESHLKRGCYKTKVTSEGGVTVEGFGTRKYHYFFKEQGDQKYSLGRADGRGYSGFFAIPFSDRSRYFVTALCTEDNMMTFAIHATRPTLDDVDEILDKVIGLGFERRDVVHINYDHCSNKFLYDDDDEITPKQLYNEKPHYPNPPAPRDLTMDNIKQNTIPPIPPPPPPPPPKPMSGGGFGSLGGFGSFGGSEPSEPARPGSKQHDGLLDNAPGLFGGMGGMSGGGSSGGSQRTLASPPPPPPRRPPPPPERSYRDDYGGRDRDRDRGRDEPPRRPPPPPPTRPPPPKYSDPPEEYKHDASDTFGVGILTDVLMRNGSRSLGRGLMSV